MKNEKVNIEIGDTIISRVLGAHNEDIAAGLYGSENSKVVEFAGPNDEEVIVEDNNGYPFSLKRDEIDAVIKDGRETFWF